MQTFCWLPPDSERRERALAAAAHVVLLQQRAGARVDAPDVEPARRATAARAVLAQGEVLRQREVEHQPAQLAVLGDVRHAGVAGGAHAAGRQTSSPAIPMLPDSASRRPAIASTSSCWPLPSTPASATISPPRTVSETPRTASRSRSSRTWRSSTSSTGSPTACVRLLHPQQHVAPDHQAREALLGGALGGHRVDLLAAPQHGHAVGDLQHLAELVADEDDRHAVVAQRAQHLEQLAGLLRGQHRGRLVEHEDAGVAVERLEDLHALLGADGHVLDHRVGVDGEAVALGQLAHPAGALAHVEQAAAPARLAAEHDVLGHGHDRHEHEVLVHHADAELDRLRRRVDLDRLAVHADLALVGVVEPVQDRHQRRLAGAVLAQQGVHLAGPQVEVDPVVRDDGTEPLRYSA